MLAAGLFAVELFAAECIAGEDNTIISLIPCVTKLTQKWGSVCANVKTHRPQILQAMMTGAGAPGV